MLIVNFLEFLDNQKDYLKVLKICNNIMFRKTIKIVQALIIEKIDKSVELIS